VFAPSKNTAVVSVRPSGSRLPRRAVLAAFGSAAAGFLCGHARAANPCVPPAELVELEIQGFGEGFRRVCVVVPRDARRISRTLVLLHGLGETHRASQALRAWPALYGAVQADERLRCPPFAPPVKKASYWADEALVRFNAELVVKPYVGAVLVCPRTPNPSLVPDREKLFESYAAWLCDVVLPEVERQLPGATRNVGLDGCSLGGYVAVETLLRRPRVFATAGCVQGALGQHRLARYAGQIGSVYRANPAFKFRIATSLRDPYLEVGKELSRRLTETAVPHELDVVPGPHNQPWLCEIGTPRLLRWHDVNLPR
jgi:pimeloyl-ACP methyl ester carboxylesterase